ncbi:hypothetical protein [Klebsiella michiganensis]|uniref:hypothetical protein n=1 Tax=Klebsiella michiganensis TaxID=1134687 RepID=UPI001CCE02EF|nr:hypothetical protein [Klebsiella michiganensis]MBZ7505940.1 hypothetical protein [Klebsiella michiganensis]
MLMKCLVSSVLFIAAPSVNAGCWVIGNLHGAGAYEYDHYNFKGDGYSGKVFVVNIDKNSPSVTDSLMTYSVISPTSMVGTYVTDLGLTIQTWQISTDKTKAFMTLNRTNTNNIAQDAVSSFVGDVKAKCDH